ncbi:hypothetical protein SAPIO_CDS5226 [Scedosporium apiospermum]|uniref:Uncharacterized protein n=1 Tax=Pseudallescheria apiosperma TaxID=563466 RepID=A0A084G647_PSEDA|nr:uncharacterized protein SAPIO_CDS5226 [Scedosporium apiospermum]KEZ42809.1 hypothetical protein SAPIO_CDS5226 [Scedosporium apiospermum]
MKTLHFALVLSHLLVLTTALQHIPVYKWTSPARSTPKPLQKRDEGYQPEFGVCEGDEVTCSACGSGYEECQGSRDDALFCFDPTKGQRCCMDNTGTACDAGFYCAGASDGNTFCCPDNLSISECANAFQMQLSSLSIPETTTIRRQSTVTETKTTPRPTTPLQNTLRSSPAPADSPSTTSTSSTPPSPSISTSTSASTSTSTSTSASIQTSTPTPASDSTSTSIEVPSSAPSIPILFLNSTSGATPSATSDSPALPSSSSASDVDPASGDDRDSEGAAIGDVWPNPAHFPQDGSVCRVACSNSGDKVAIPREVEVTLSEVITKAFTVTVPGRTGCDYATTITSTLTFCTVETVTLDCEPTPGIPLEIPVATNTPWEDGPDSTLTFIIPPPLAASEPITSPEAQSYTTEIPSTPEVPSAPEEVTVDIPKGTPAVDVPSTKRAESTVHVPTTPSTVLRSRTTTPTTTSTTLTTEVPTSTLVAGGASGGSVSKVITGFAILLALAANSTL